MALDLCAAVSRGWHCAQISLPTYRAPGVAWVGCQSTRSSCFRIGPYPQRNGAVHPCARYSTMINVKRCLSPSPCKRCELLKQRKGFEAASAILVVPDCPKGRQPLATLLAYYCDLNRSRGEDPGTHGMPCLGFSALFRSSRRFRNTWWPRSLKTFP